jgi:hypothetical protein
MISRPRLAGNAPMPEPVTTATAMSCAPGTNGHADTESCRPREELLLDERLGGQRDWKQLDEIPRAAGIFAHVAGQRAPWSDCCCHARFGARRPPGGRRVNADAEPEA